VVFDSVSIVNWMEDHTLLRSGRFSVIHLDHEDRPQICHLYARATHHVKTHFLKMLHEDVANYWGPFHSHVIFLLEELSST
jgi:hypothetical protein